MKRFLPTMHQGVVELELISFDQRTLHSTFRITFNAFSKTEITVSGKVIEDLYKNAKMLINDVPIDKEAFKDIVSKESES